MSVDQEFVRKNIDLVMKEFLKIHPQTSQQNKSKHKRNLLQNADTFSYRPIYHIAKTVREREVALREKLKRALRERDEYKTHLGVWKSKYDAAAGVAGRSARGPDPPLDKTT